MKTNVMHNYDKVLIINFLPPYIKILLSFSLNIALYADF